jgi:flagellar M-ring protein FliF
LEKIREFFTNLPTQVGSFWNNLSMPKRLAVVSLGVLLVTAVASLFFFRESDPYEYLFVDVSPEDTNAISAYLKKSGLTDYIVDDKGIKVPSANVTQFRVKLAEEGLPTRGQVGWEKFDDPDFTRTEFERKINKTRAIQGELARTITNIEGIISARVHITQPQERLFEKDQKKPTAAVYLKTNRSTTLTAKQIKGIVHLISKSVEGLEPDNISIIDYEGKLLTEEKSKDANARQTKEMLDYQTNVEKSMEEKIRAIVGRIVGQERVEAKVEVSLDFTSEEQTISDLNPDKTVAISTNTTNQRLDGSGLNPTGIPGSKSNVPGEQEALNLSTSRAESKNDSELINYEVSKTISHKKMPVGTIKRISAAVIIDGKQATAIAGVQPPFEPRTEEEMSKITELVKSAIGYTDKRDEVKVHNLPFQLDYVQVEALQAKKSEDRQYISTLAISGVVALSLVLFFAFIVRPYFRWLSYDPERKHKEAIVEEFRPDLEMGGIQNIQVKEDVPFDKLTPQEQVMYLARHEPQRTTEALRMLLNPHQGGV